MCKVTRVRIHLKLFLQLRPGASMEGEEGLEEEEDDDDEEEVYEMIETVVVQVAGSMS